MRAQWAATQGVYHVSPLSSMNYLLRLTIRHAQQRLIAIDSRQLASVYGCFGLQSKLSRPSPSPLLPVSSVFPLLALHPAAVIPLELHPLAFLLLSVTFRFSAFAVRCTWLSTDHRRPFTAHSMQCNTILVRNSSYGLCSVHRRARCYGWVLTQYEGRFQAQRRTKWMKEA